MAPKSKCYVARMRGIHAANAAKAEKRRIREQRSPVGAHRLSRAQQRRRRASSYASSRSDSASRQRQESDSEHDSDMDTPQHDDENPRVPDDGAVNVDFEQDEQDEHEDDNDAVTVDEDQEQEMVSARADIDPLNGVSLHKLVKQLEQILQYLQISYDDLKMSIDELLNRGDEIITSNEITHVLESFFHGLTRKFKSAGSSQHVAKNAKRCAREVVIMVKYALIELSHPSLVTMQERLEESIDQMEFDGKIVRNDHIKDCIKNVFFNFSTS